MWLVQVRGGGVRRFPSVPSSLLSVTSHSALKASVPSKWIRTAGLLYPSRLQTMGRLHLLLTSSLQAYLGFSTSLTSSLFFQWQPSLLTFILWTLVTISLACSFGLSRTYNNLLLLPSHYLTVTCGVLKLRK